MGDHLVGDPARVAPHAGRIHPHGAVEAPKLLAGRRSRRRFNRAGTRIGLSATRAVRGPDLLKSGTLDLVAIVDPLRSRIVASDVGYIAAEYVGEVDPDVLISGWMATGDWVRKNVEVVASFRAAIDEGLTFIKANPEEVHEIEKQYIGFNSPRFPTFENKARPEDLKVFIAIGNELGLYRTAFRSRKARAAVILPRRPPDSRT
jgi:hypothetical protein